MRRGGWYIVAVAGLCSAALIIVWREWPHTSAGQFDPVGASLTLASLGSGAIGLWQGARAQRLADTDTVATAARLAVVARNAETEALSQLLGRHNQTIDVHFTFSRVPAHEAVGAKTRGTLTEVVDYYRALRPRRLVITGAGGSGKTVLAVQLILQLLNERTPDDPVPVRLSAALLDTGRQTETAVVGWLTDYLRHTYRLPSAAAAHLVTARMVLPILDGLDEMDAAERPGYDSRAGQAIRACNAYLDGADKGGIVLTCRIGQYEALLEAREWIHDAAHVQIAPVGLVATRAFLKARVIDESRWQPVLKAMRAGGNQPLAAALSTPWRLTLAAMVYEQRDRDGNFRRNPAELTAPDLNTEEKVRDHLLGLFIPAVVSTQSSPYLAARVHQWLATLARYLERNTPGPNRPARSLGDRALSGTDLVLHELWPIGGGRLPRVLPIIAGSFVWEAFTAFMPSSVDGYSAPDIFSINPVLVFAGLAWVNIWPHPVNLDFQQLRNRGRTRKFFYSLMIGLAAGFDAWRFIGPETALAILLAYELTIGFTTGLNRSYTPTGTQDGLKSAVLSNLAIGLAVGLAFGLGFGIAIGAASGLVLGLTIGLTITLVYGIAIQPYGSRYIALLLCTREWTSRWLPWRLKRFLDWCYGVGLLRIAGFGYQFRHRELQDYLAHHPTESDSRPDLSRDICPRSARRD